ncbi:CheY-like superfamily [Arabidopsis suecica]|uniref:CheY-like superfamily n=1 Tax=Arabidopsis suecica TaxID=45249 RepID=A0A8T2EA61_ARASU|nr:CheY-like superfamily [Arabidopsis suecica]KAG7620908.1 CheY-like superfamily [Arabidopsis suecica]
MVITANDLSKWENFPKGLKVLLLLNGCDSDGDGSSAAETRSELESMDYIVTTFTDETEALSAVVKNPESFHIAIVEVNMSAESESFKFLEAAKDVLPTIMISTDHCITSTMKCIALGAVEFLQKPLSPEKLKNIWQHVVHKAFNDGGSNVSVSLKPVKESVVSMLHLETDMTIDEKDPAPSTPQLKQDSRLLDGDCQENINFSMENVNSSTEKDNMEDHQDIGESKSVDTTNRKLDDDKVVVKEERGDSEKEEEGETGDLISEKTDSVDIHKKEDGTKPINKSSGIKNVSGNKTSRKKVDWTPELHKKFVQAVEQLGVDQAIPSRILELMKVGTLTRHNVASHLQKFRQHRKNILPKDDHNHRWIQSRENHRPSQRNYNGFQQQHRPVMAYPVWGLPGVYPPGAIPPLWPPPLQSIGQPPPWHWKPPYPTVNGNAWGCPVGPPVTGSYITPSNTTGGGFQYPNGAETGFKIMPASQPDEEMLDQVVKEAISKPWLPLPLGLKPPSAESVLAELTRQGISAVPSSSCLINGSHRLR